MVLNIDVVVDSQLVRTLQVEATDTLQELRALIDKELSIPKWSQKLYLQTNTMQNTAAGMSTISTVVEVSSVGRCGALGTSAKAIEVIVKRRDPHVAEKLEDLWENTTTGSAVDRWFREQSEADRGNYEIVMEVLIRNGESLKHASEEMKGTRAVVLQAVQGCGEALEFASPKMKKDHEVVMASVCFNGMALQYAAEEAQKDPVLVRAALANDKRAKTYAKVDPSDYRAATVGAVYVPDRVYQVMGLMGHLCTVAAEPTTQLMDVKVLIEKQTSIPKWEQKLLFLGQEVRSVAAFQAVPPTEPVLLIMVQRSPEVAAKLAEIEAQPTSTSVAQWLLSQDEEWKNDFDVVLQCVLRSGESLEWASADLKRNKDIVMTAVAKDGTALRHVGTDLRNDKEVVMQAVKLHGMALEHASPTLKADKEVVIAAIKQDELSARFASQ